MNMWFLPSFHTCYKLFLENGINPPCFATLVEEGLDQDELQELGLSDGGIEVLSKLLRV